MRGHPNLSERRFIKKPKQQVPATTWRQGTSSCAMATARRAPKSLDFLRGAMSLRGGQASWEKCRFTASLPRSLSSQDQRGNCRLVQFLCRFIKTVCCLDEPRRQPADAEAWPLSPFESLVKSAGGSESRSEGDLAPGHLGVAGGHGQQGEHGRDRGCRRQRRGGEGRASACSTGRDIGA